MVSCELELVAALPMTPSLLLPCELDVAAVSSDMSSSPVVSSSSDSLELRTICSLLSGLERGGMSSQSAPETILSQCSQYQFPSGTSPSGGERQSRWYLQVLSRTGVLNEPVAFHGTNHGFRSPLVTAITQQQALLSIAFPTDLYHTHTHTSMNEYVHRPFWPMR